jgi:hypothetical protein
VPVANKGDGLEVRVVFPSGPLAGELTARTSLLVKGDKK